MSESKKKQAKSDERIRNLIEEKFGAGKRRFSLDRVMAKFSNTSETTIAILFLVMNISAWVRPAFWLGLCLFHHTNLFSGFGSRIISKSYFLSKKDEQNLLF
ncbi:transposase [Tychonema sp. LEGE 07199]|nr:transposase [Tychonema sp. LEGE 07199]MBE9134216.1 transposase [Tychonema sp. LEGE 07196]